MTTNGSPKFSIVHHHQRIDEHGGEHQTDGEIAKCIVHALDLAEYLDRVARRELFLQRGDHFIYVTGNAAEIATLNAGVDVVGRLDVGLIGIGRHAVPRESRYVTEQPRYPGYPTSVLQRRPACCRDIIQRARLRVRASGLRDDKESQTPDRSRNSG